MVVLIDEWLLYRLIVSGSIGLLMGMIETVVALT